MPVSDVVIIGGGIAGASLAFRLADRCDVVLLEAESQPGYHSTGRSAALFTTTYGHEVIRALTLASRDFLTTPPDGFSPHPLMEPRGALWVANQDQQGRLRAFLDEVRRLDPSVMACDAGEAISRCPVLDPDYLAAAVLEPQACDIDVHSLHHGFLAGFRRRGGRIETDSRVTALNRDGAWNVATSRDHYSAPIVVNAAGAWADEVAALAGARQIGLVPKRRTAITFDLPAGLEPGHWPCVLDADEAFYFKPDAGRLLASPADETPTRPCDAQPEELDIALTVDRIETATTLRVPRIASRWAGLRSFVSDKVPVVGPDAELENFHWLAGLGGYGIMTSPAISEVAAAAIMGESVPAAVAAFGVDLADLRPERLQALSPVQP